MGKIFTVLILALLVTTLLYGQNPDVSAESRSAAKINFNFNKSLTLSVEGQLRLKSTGNLYDRSFTQAKIEYKFWRFFDVGLGYRFINQKDQEGLLSKIENHYRWNYSISGRMKLNRLSSKTRVQYQTRREILPNTNRFVGDYRKYWRFKTSLKYNIKSWKLDPRVGYEIFLRSADHPQGQFNKFRWTLSTTYKLKGPQQIGLGYKFEREIKKWNPQIVHIVEVQYTYTFKHKN